MSTYVIQAGDSLSRIAARTLGSAGKWRLLAEVNRLVNPNKLKVGQTLQIPDETARAPNVVNAGGDTVAAATETVRILVEGKTVFAVPGNDSPWIKVGTLHRKGLYRVGLQAPEDFIANSGGLLRDLHLTDSEINIMLATAENEGNLDAVNTWDSQFMSFGMFQWTAGSPGKPGELASLLQRIQRHYPDDFEHYWGRFGLDLIDVGSNTGWLRLNGKRLSSAGDKQALREHIWCYRFAQAGADAQVQAAQIAHAVGRLGQFYSVRSRRLGGWALADLITSEFGVALLLDNHVNRPGYVFPCVAEAMASVGMAADDLVQGSADDERAVIGAYLDIRNHYGRSPMTDAAHRGEVTRRYLLRGVISDRRGSFQSNRD